MYIKNETENLFHNFLSHFFCRIGKFDFNVVKFPKGYTRGQKMIVSNTYLVFYGDS